MSSVNSPSHYKIGTITVDEFIEEQGLSFREGCVVKYVCRWKGKDGLQDLKKAAWYLDKLIQSEEARLKHSNKTKGEGNGVDQQETSGSQGG